MAVVVMAVMNKYLLVLASRWLFRSRFGSSTRVWLAHIGAVCQPGVRCSCVRGGDMVESKERRAGVMRLRQRLMTEGIMRTAPEGLDSAEKHVWVTAQARARYKQGERGDALPGCIVFD